MAAIVTDLVPEIVYPQKDKWNGKVTAVYIRNSTPSQKGNFRSEFQVTDMAEYALGLGYATCLYDEQGKSGKSLSGRKLATLMVAHLRAGIVQGIVCGDLSRLTRDQTGYDAADIGNAIVESADGLLITAGKVWDLRVDDDWRMYQVLTMVAGWQWADIINKTHTGLLKKAMSEPLWRGHLKIGYRRVARIGPDGNPLVRPNGRPHYDVEKNEADEEVLRALQEQFNIQPSLPAVCAAMNEKKIPSPWNTRASGGPKSRTEGRRWVSKLLERILKDDTYFGEPRFIWDTDTPAKIWNKLLPGQDVDVKTISHQRPELAYWTRSEVAYWRKKFLGAKAVRTRNREHNHLLLGILVCPTCGTLMQKNGTNGRELMYACPGYYGSRGVDCSNPRIIGENMAFRALRELLPDMLTDTRALADAAARRIAASGPTVAETQLQQVRDKETWLRTEVIEPAMKRMTKLEDWVHEQREELAAERERLEVQVRAERDDADLGEYVARVAEELASNPLEKFDKKTREVQAAIYRLLVTNVKISDNGGRGRGRRTWVEEGDYSLLVECGSGRSLPRALSYLTDLLAA